MENYSYETMDEKCGNCDQQSLIRVTDDDANGEEVGVYCRNCQAEEYDAI